MKVGELKALFERLKVDDDYEFLPVLMDDMPATEPPRPVVAHHEKWVMLKYGVK